MTMNKLKKAIINCKPSKLFKAIGCFMIAAAIVNAIFGNYMTVAWTALCAMLEFMIAGACNDTEYWQSQAFKILSLAEEQDKMLDSFKDELEKTDKKLAEANKVLTATIIDRDNANAEIAKLKLEIEQLEKEKTESIFLAVDKGSNEPKIFTSKPKRHNEMFSGNGYLGRIILEKNVYNPDLSNLTFDISPIEIKILHKILF